MHTTRAYAGERLPPADALDWLVVLGGAMSVHDEAALPWLAEEKKLLRQAVAAGKKVLGICLGAQMLAESLGARVRKNPTPEIGWFPIHLTAEARRHPLLSGTRPELTVFHWHEETFDLPPDGVRLAASTACANQAFAVGDRLLGLQFHPEVTAQDVGQWLRDGASCLPSGPFVQTPAAMREATAAAAMETWLGEILDRFARPAVLR